MIHLPTWYLQAYKGKVVPIHNKHCIRKEQGGMGL